MKKVLIGLTVVTLLALGAIAYAHGPGGWGGEYMMGPGYGGHMYGSGNHMMGYGMGSGYGMMGSGYRMGPGYGNHMYGQYGAETQKFLEETADLRKELNSKKFEYTEALRNPKTDPETITKLENQITDLQDKIFAKAPETAQGRFGGYGCNRQ